MVERQLPKLNVAGSNPVSRSTSEWTAFHSKSPAEWLGISHTAPSFLLSAKSHARLACSVAVACKATSLITTARCRYQLFAELCLAALEIHFVSPLQQEEYRARQRAMLFFYPLCQGTRILPVQNADRRTNKGDCCTMYEHTQRLRKSVVSRLKDAKCGPQFMCSPA